MHLYNFTVESTYYLYVLKIVYGELGASTRGIKDDTCMVDAYDQSCNPFTLNVGTVLDQVSNSKYGFLRCQLSFTVIARNFSSIQIDHSFADMFKMILE